MSGLYSSDSGVESFCPLGDIGGVGRFCFYSTRATLGEKIAAIEIADYWVATTGSHRVWLVVWASVFATTCAGCRRVGVYSGDV